MTNISSDAVTSDGAIFAADHIVKGNLSSGQALVDLRLPGDSGKLALYARTELPDFAQGRWLLLLEQDPDRDWVHRFIGGYPQDGGIRIHRVAPLAPEAQEKHDWWPQLEAEYLAAAQSSDAQIANTGLGFLYDLGFRSDEVNAVVEKATRHSDAAVQALARRIKAWIGDSAPQLPR